jgi:hypothetical protein
MLDHFDAAQLRIASIQFDQYQPNAISQARRQRRLSHSFHRGQIA